MDRVAAIRLAFGEPARAADSRADDQNAGPLGRREAEAAQLAAQG
jgi:hypothetical protein